MNSTFYYTRLNGCQPQTLTCLAMGSGVTRAASTRVRIDSVSTSCSIHTRITAAFVDVYENNITFCKIWKNRLQKNKV